MDTAIREIMMDYERQLSADKREQKKRVRGIYERLPEYKALEDRTADISAKAAILAASGQKEEAAALVKELGRISEEKKKLLADAGVPDGYLSVQYACPDCRDTGYIRGRRQG